MEENLKFDEYGRSMISEESLASLLYRHPDINLSKFGVINPTKYNEALHSLYLDWEELPLYQKPSVTVDEFDTDNQNNWFMPEEYQKFDIAKWILDQCVGDTELQRAGEELILFYERNMVDLLRYLKYLVDTMRQHKIVWGVGRGSSVASFVLFKIGVHKINSIEYGLSIDEFIK